MTAEPDDFTRRDNLQDHNQDLIKAQRHLMQILSEEATDSSHQIGRRWCVNHDGGTSLRPVGSPPWLQGSVTMPAMHMSGIGRGMVGQRGALTARLPGSLPSPARTDRHGHGGQRWRGGPMSPLRQTMPLGRRSDVYIPGQGHVPHLGGSKGMPWLDATSGEVLSTPQQSPGPRNQLYQSRQSLISPRESVYTPRRPLEALMFPPVYSHVDVTES